MNLSRQTARPLDSLVVILSVDWEPDHGAWKYTGTEMDYGGILKGTPAFCDVLDELRIPCTWFIESSYDARRDLPGCFPDLVRQLARRKQDETGLHIHWRRPAADASVAYETSDVGWVSAQIDHGIGQLAALGARPRAFRSGALLHVTDLPRMLGEKGFLVDSSTLWGRANRLKPDKKRVEEKTLVARCGTVLHRAFAALPDPYFVDEHDVEQRGTSDVVEFPITYSVFDSRTFAQGTFARYLKYRALLAGGTQYLMLFFHIDELTRNASGPDQQAEPDRAVLQHFRNHLSGLQNNGAKFVTCSAARNRWLCERSPETPKLCVP